MTSIEIKSPAALNADEIDFWNQLHRDQPSLSHPQFHVHWTQLVAKIRDQVYVAVVRGTHGIAAIFPFERSGDKAGQPVAGILSDQHGVITDYVAGKSSWDLKELLKQCELRFWKFDHLPLEHKLLTPHVAITDPAAHVDLSNGYDDHYADLKVRHGSWCKQIERKRRKLAREVGPLRFEMHTHDDVAMKALLAWKQSQLIDVGLHNVFCLEWAQRLLRLVATHRSTQFAGWLSTLHAGSQLVAVHLGQSSGYAFNSWIPSYHPDYATYSPGAILQLDMHRQCVDEGLTSIDLGRGMNPLKTTLATSYEDLGIGSIDFRPLASRLTKFKWLCRRAAEENRTGKVAIRAGRKLASWLQTRQNCSVTTNGNLS